MLRYDTKEASLKKKERDIIEMIITKILFDETLYHPIAFTSAFSVSLRAEEKRSIFFSAFCCVHFTSII
jgi:hypothetical protein